MNKKYKFTGKTKQYLNIRLHQIQALRSFGEVSEGDIGGWIEKEENLSHVGDCWVGGSAQVYGDAWVYGSAWVYEDAQVYGDARVYGHAQVYRSAHVCGSTKVYGRGRVSKNLKTSTNNLPEELNTLPESIEEVTIKGVKYKKVTKWERA